MQLFIIMFLLLYGAAMSVIAYTLHKRSKEDFEELQSWRKILSRADDLHTIH